MKNMILFMTIISFSTMAGIAEKTLRPTALIALKKNSALHSNICNSLKNECVDDSVIWKENKSNNTYYLISPGLKLIKIQSKGVKYIKTSSWNFSKEEKNDNVQFDDLSRDKTFIYPALYPLNKTTQAVALVYRWSTGYSGGGSEEEVANFMMINDDGTYKKAFENIPFSSREMIRACFTEQDYAKHKHCHDESWSTLNLKIIDDAENFYLWKFIIKSYSWPAFTEKHSVQISKKEAYPFK